MSIDDPKRTPLSLGDLGLAGKDDSVHISTQNGITKIHFDNINDLFAGGASDEKLIEVLIGCDVSRNPENLLSNDNKKHLLYMMMRNRVKWGYIEEKKLKSFFDNGNTNTFDDDVNVFCEIVAKEFDEDIKVAKNRSNYDPMIDVLKFTHKYAPYKSSSLLEKRNEFIEYILNNGSDDLIIKAPLVEMLLPSEIREQRGEMVKGEGELFPTYESIPGTLYARILEAKKQVHRRKNQVKQQAQDAQQQEVNRLKSKL